MLKFAGILLLAMVLVVAATLGGIYMYLSPEAPPAKVPSLSSVRVVGSGEIVGFEGKAGSHVWLGIPFAQPPVNDLRWRAPRPVVPRDSRREMLGFGDRCLQFPILPEGEQPRTLGSEDCLTLNVFAPMFEPAKVPEGVDRLPVMFWIHGGGNTVGSASDSPYDGSLLATGQEVLVVTVNYRLGPMGWFGHRALRETSSSREDASGNYGTLDLIAGLSWVRDNIESFGGDPANVTIFGESAGGFNVLALMSSPLAQGLFHRAIVQSGGLWFTSVEDAEQVVTTDRGDARLSSREIIARLFVKEGRAKTRDEALGLQDAIPASALSGWLRGISGPDLYSVLLPDEGAFGGMIDAPANLTDGYVLPDMTAEDIFSNPDNYAGVPVMIGSNRDESKLFMAFLDEYVEKTMGLPTRIKDIDRYNRDAGYSTALWRTSGVDELADLMSRNDPGNVYAYRFDADDWRNYGSVHLKDLFGAAHAFEVPFVFGYFSNPLKIVFPDSTFSEVERLSDSMMSYWGEFAHSGKPGAGRYGKEPQWLPWSHRGGGSFILLDTELDGGIRMERGMLTFEAVKGDMMAELSGLPLEQRCASYRNATRARGFDPVEYGSLGCPD